MFKPAFAYERTSPNSEGKAHFRIHDARDNAICFCYLEEHAVQVVRALSAAHPPRAGEVTEAVDRVMQGYVDAYPTDVWPEVPFTDAQAASVMRLMVPRIREALTAALGRPS